MDKIDKQVLAQQSQSFRERIDLVRNNLFPILIITLSSLVFSIIYALNAVNIYRATTSIKITKPTGNILGAPLIPDATIGDLQGDRFLMNEIEIIRSSQVREKVARAVIDSFNAAKNPRDFYLLLDPQTRKSKNVKAKIATFNQIVSELKKVDIEQKRGIDFVEISVQSPAPIEAALIANCYATSYRNVNLDITRNQLTMVRSFLIDQRDEKKRELTDAEEALKQFQEKGGVVALDQQARTLIDEISNIESKRDYQKIDLLSSERNIQKYRDELAKRSPNITAYLDQVASEEYLRTIQQQLAELKLNKEMVLVTLKGQSAASNEVIKEYDKKIKVLQDLLDQKIEVLKNSIFAVTPDELRSLTQKVITEEVTAQSLRISIEQLTKLLTEYEGKFNLLPKSSIELGQLQRNRESIEKLFLMIEEKYQEAMINEQSQPGNVLIVDAAKVPSTPYKPNRTLIIIVGLVLGMAIAVGYVFLRNYFDNTVKTPDDIQKLNTNVLAWIPQIEGIVATGSSDFEFIVARKPDSIPSESFRALRTRVQFSRVDTDTLKTVLVTSSAPSEGKTIICTNLAGSFALSNKKTLILDCDLRKPRIHSFFRTNRYPGLVDHLFGQVTLDEIVRTSEIPDLFYITAGTVPPNPSEILESQKMKDFLRMLRDKFDCILIDSPPIIAVTDSEILARLADATALVVSANTTEVELMLRSLEIIRQDNINFIGTILNNFVYKSSYGSYYKYYYYYTRPRKTDRSKLPPAQSTT